MKRQTVSLFAFSFVLLVGAALSQETVNVRGASLQVKGALETIDDIPILYTWGSPWEQGFAHGYLLKDRIVWLMEGYLSNGMMMSVQEYEYVTTNLRFIKIPSQYEAELRGMFEGLVAREGGPVRVEVLKRTVKYDDLVMMNAVADLSRARFSCSSFAAWGSITCDGGTYVGRNYEWPKNPALLSCQVVYVRLPPTGGKALGTVSVFFPGQVGLITAMNEQGVTVATHDSTTNQPSFAWGFTPICLLYRHAIERARAETAKEDISETLTSLHTVTGNNMMVGRPYDGENPAGFVMEHDADLTQGNGFTVREVEDELNFIVSTNRYYERQSSHKGRSCSRFKTLSRKLAMINSDSGEEPMNLVMAWETINAAPLTQLATYHQVVFEPNKKRMHIAFPADQDLSKRITLDVTEHLEKAKEKAKTGNR